jgi:hypothetical protein
MVSTKDNIFENFRRHKGKERFNLFHAEIKKRLNWCSSITDDFERLKKLNHLKSKVDEAIEELSDEFGWYILEEDGKYYDINGIEIENIDRHINNYTREYIKEGIDIQFKFVPLNQQINKEIDKCKYLLEEAPGLSKKETTSRIRKKLEIPPLNELTQPNLKHEEITLLIKLLKDEKLITNTNVSSNTDIALFFAYLTGYSPERIRQKLSSPTLSKITKKKEHYEHLIEELNNLTGRLKDELNKLNNNKTE